jgi:putative hydrolase of the HAD superfamily
MLTIKRDVISTTIGIGRLVPLDKPELASYPQGTDEDDLPARKGGKMDSSRLLTAILSKKAIIFDLFHTLVALERRPGDGQPQLHELLGVTHEAFVEQLMLTAHDRLVGNKKDAYSIVAGIAHAIDASISDSAIQRTADRILEVFAAALQGVPARITSVLASLAAGGKRLGLVSNASAMEVAGWPRSPLAPLFDSVVFSCFCGSVKPEERIYLICTDELKVAPEDCAFVGDGESNELEGAKNLCMTTIMTTEFIRGIATDVLDQRRRWADFVIPNLDLLIEEFDRS